MKPLLSIQNSISNAFLPTLAFSAYLLSTTAQADSYTIDTLIIDKVYTFATPPGAQSAGGYLTITNTGLEDDTLIGGTSSFASATEIHEMQMVEDIMKMRHLTDGISIPAGATVELAPGGLHIMFMQLTQSLKDGASLAGTLRFNKAGTLPVDFEVIDRRNIDNSHGDNSHGDNSHGDSKHGDSKHGHTQKHDSKSHKSMNHDSTEHNTKKE